MTSGYAVSNMKAAACILLKSCRLVHAVVAIPSGVVTCLNCLACLHADCCVADDLTSYPALQMYPAQIRSTAHGISAATGKVGSICVVVWLNYLGNRNKFWITWPVALLGAVICWVFVADLTGLDLAEQVCQAFTAIQRCANVHTICLLLLLFWPCGVESTMRSIAVCRYC